MTAAPVRTPVRIRVITPLCDAPAEMTAMTLDELAPLRPLGLEFSAVCLDAGPASIESAFDETLAAPHVAIAAMQAEAEGMDAVLIDCMGDPGLEAAREAVSIPVVGPGEAAMHMAAISGHRFSCVTILDSVRPRFHARARLYGCSERLASVRAINMPVLEIERNLADLPDLLFVEARRAVVEDGADTIILGCTGFLGVAAKLEAMLKQAGHPVPVINPMPVASLLAATMVWSGLPHSKKAWPRPPFAKAYAGFTFPP